MLVAVKKRRKQYRRIYKKLARGKIIWKTGEKWRSRGTEGDKEDGSIGN